MLFGLCGHPGTQTTYGHAGNSDGVALSTQVQLLKALNATMYRLDVLPSIADSVINEVGTALNQAGLFLLPVISSKTNAEIKAITFTSATETGVLQALYDETKAYVQSKVALFDKYTYGSYWEMPNELDLLCVQGSQVAGSKAEHYIQNRLKICYWLMKGAIDGTKAANPNAKVIVNCAGWYHYFFFRLLEHPEYFGPDFASYTPIDFDVIGWHWYSTDGLLFAQNATSDVNQNVLAALRSFGKKIWITETNRKYGNQNSSTYDQNNQFVIEDSLQKIINQGSDIIEAVFLYMLLDETTGDTNLDYYGLCKVSAGAPYTVTQRKPAFYSAKRLFSRNRQASAMRLSVPFGDTFVRKTTILGSSTAAGTGPTDPNRAWAVQLNTSEVALGRTVSNLAVAGHTTRYGQPHAKEFSEVVETANATAAFLTSQPDVLIMAYNNDVVTGYETTETMANIKRIADYCATFNTKFFICTTQPRNVVASQKTKLKEQADLIKSTYGNDAIDLFTPFARTDGTIDDTLYNIIEAYNADGTHLNDAAHDIIYSAVKQKVEAYYATLTTYNRFPDIHIKRYVAEVQSVTGMTYPVSMAHLQRIENLIGTLQGENYWSTLRDAYIHGTGLNVSVADAIVSLKTIFPMFDSQGAFASQTATTNVSNTSTGLVTKASRFVLPAGPCSIIACVKGTTQVDDYATIVGWHNAGTARRGLIGTGASTNSDELALFQDGQTLIAESTGNFFDDKIRVCAGTFNGTRWGLYRDLDATEVAGVNSTGTPAQVRTSLCANNQGAGPNNFVGTNYFSAIFSAAYSGAAYVTLANLFTTQLGLTVEQT